MWQAKIVNVQKTKDEIVSFVEFTNNLDGELYNLNLNVKNIAEQTKVDDTIQTELKRLNELDIVWENIKKTKDKIIFEKKSQKNAVK